MKQYDDPYVFLAYYILLHTSTPDIKRLMVDNDFLKRMVIKDVRAMDLYGPFVDCIVQVELDEGGRTALMHELDKFGAYLFTKLDRERLRSKIIEINSFYNIIEL